jgi:hypothetical protein
VKKKIIAGNSARKKVKESAEALVVIDPCHKPLKKKILTS